jgi:hypothetical protein
MEAGVLSCFGDDNHMDESNMTNLIRFFSNEQAPTISLSGREIALLDAVGRAGATGVCAADLQRAIAAVTGKEPRLATLYGAISDLQRKGLLGSASSVEETAGRPRRLFKLTRSGRLALNLGEAMASSDASALAPA